MDGVLEPGVAGWKAQMNGLSYSGALQWHSCPIKYYIKCLFIFSLHLTTAPKWILAIWHSWRMGLSSHQGLIVFPIYVSERLTIKKVRGGGQVLTVVVFCSDYLSSNPNWVYNFSVDLWFKITKNKQKVGRDWPVFLTKGRRLALSHLKSLQKSGEESLT